MIDGQKVWLWKNGDHFLVFDNPYPCYGRNGEGDPMVFGEPAAVGYFRSSIEREKAEADASNSTAIVRREK